MGDSAIEVESLSKRYGGKAVLTDLSFTVESSTCVAILGPNGAGKTTTVEILEGYRTWDSGRVSVLGEDPRRAGPEWRSRRGVVLQGAADLGELRVRETVEFFAALYPDPWPVQELLEMVGLSAAANRPIRALSGGQRRRVDVALGVVGRPELLFLDEPTTGFDPEARRKFWELIESLKRSGTTIVLTTHYLDEAEALADKIVILNHGQVLMEGRPEEIGRSGEGDCLVRWRRPSGELVEVPTAEPSSLIAAEFASTGRELADLEVVRPGLEDRYLHLLAEEG